MGSDQGWFESDEDYARRVAEEADERTIENASGDAPSQGWFESDERYRERIATEANGLRIEASSGEAPSQGWFESDDAYRERIEKEANERTIEAASGDSPSQGWFESDDDYRVRVRREANESLIEGGQGAAARQGWFEGDHEYRRRIALEAREVRREGKRPSSRSTESTEDAEAVSDESTSAWEVSSDSPIESRGSVQQGSKLRPPTNTADLRLLQLRAVAALSERERSSEWDRRKLGRSRETSTFQRVTDNELVYLGLLLKDPVPQLVWWTELQLSPPHEFELLARIALERLCEDSSDVREAVEYLRSDGEWRLWGGSATDHRKWDLHDYLEPKREQRRVREKLQAEQAALALEKERERIARQPKRVILRALATAVGLTVVLLLAGSAYLIARVVRSMNTHPQRKAVLGETTLRELNEAWRTGVIRHWIANG